MIQGSSKQWIVRLIDRHNFVDVWSREKLTMILYLNDITEQKKDGRVHSEVSLDLHKPNW